MYARFYVKQSDSVESKEICSNPNFSFDAIMSDDKLSIYCDDLRFLFISQIDNKEERRLIKVVDLAEADKLWRKIYKDLDKNGYKVVGMISADDMNASGRTLEIDRLMNEVEKEEGLSDYKSPNPYRGMDEHALKEQYFSLANNILPMTLASGFLKAMEKYRKKCSGEHYEICCVIDIQNLHWFFLLVTNVRIWKMSEFFTFTNVIKQLLSV